MGFNLARDTLGCAYICSLTTNPALIGGVFSVIAAALTEILSKPKQQDKPAA